MRKKKKDIIKELSINTKDVGSTEVQIGLLSNKIDEWSLQFKKLNLRK